ncbi:unnamed protein product [Lepeophtheirus salmonis]|uniref:(salmon louse) hypothetical protein n=1 Tax=Lepeophtheirus salmonis TaxID=72036 RepID=A0A7R8CBI3_LEPSM|nr:unnamed protein product [Lepeophtheirus salmonis]CAF2760956.1 unnamed protein product [Lepeophtheirus salmonis]
MKLNLRISVNFSLLVLFITLERRVEGGSNCIPLTECSPLKYFLKHRGSRIKYDRFRINNILWKKRCGFDPYQNTPKVNCPDKEYPVRETNPVQAKSSGVINGKITRDVCMGSLRIHHNHVRDGSDIKINVLSEVIGNCCWKINERTRHRGKTQLLHGGFDDEPDIQPKSVQVFMCQYL